MGPKRTWRAALMDKITGVVGAPLPSRTPETGYRDPYVEVPMGPESPAARALRAHEEYANAENDLTQTQFRDAVEDVNESIDVLRRGVARIYKHMPKDRHDERISSLSSLVHQLQWLIEWRLEQLASLRYSILKHCSSGHAARILQDGTASRFLPRGGRQLVRDAIPAPAPGCTSEEHVYQIGEPRCDCGRVAVRAAPATP